jgi:hypothetical protein
VSCQDARALFSDAVDGVLSADAQARLNAHVAGCVDCRRELERFRRTVSLLREAEPLRAPAGFVDRVRAAVRPEPWWMRVGRRLVSPWPTRIPQVAAVAAVAIVTVYLYRGTPEQTRAGREGVPSGAEQSTREVPRQTAEELRPPTPPPPPESGAIARAPTTPSTASDKAAPAPVKERRAAPPPARNVEPRADVAPAPPATAPAAPPVPSGPGERRSEEAFEARKPTMPSAADPGRDRPAAGLGRAATPPSDSSRLVAKTRTAPAAHLEGRLQGLDRADGRARVTALVVGLGGSVTSEQTLADGFVIEALVPRARYGELVHGLAQLGRWSPVAEPPLTGDPVPAVIRLD